MSDSKKAYKNWKVQQGGDIIFPNQVWQAACDWKASAQDGGEPVAWLCIKPDGKPWGAVTNQGSVNVWMRQESLGRTVCPLYTHPPSAVVPEPFGTESAYQTAKNPILSSSNMIISSGLVRDLVEALRKADTQQPSAVVPEWISVKDRLPLKPSADIVFEQQEYLVTDGVIVGVCDFQRGNGAGNPWASWGMYGYGGLPRQSITHWMELPQPPNQEKDTLN
jgi:hypothetical protein